MLQWMGEHWFLSFVLMWICVEAFVKLVSRILRTINIVCRGWPTNRYMDADGDLQETVVNHVMGDVHDVGTINREIN